jgi:tellurite resistance protein TehA-like permease
MTDQQQLEQLRRLFLAAPESDSARVIAIVASLLMVVTVLWLVRRRVLREEFTPIWVGVAFALTLVSVRGDLLHALTRAIGAWTSSSTLFALGELALLLICLTYAVRLSRQSTQIKDLAQELALLRAQVEGSSPGAPSE